MTEMILDKDSCRWEDCEYDYDANKQIFQLQFKVEKTGKHPDDEMLIMLAIDAIASLIEDRGSDPFIIIEETLKLRRGH